MAGKTEKPEEKPVATEFQSVSVPAVDFGAKSAWVSGRLVRTDTGAGVEDAEVSIAVDGSSAKAVTTNTTASGKFTASVNTGSLSVGSHDLTFSYEGDEPLEGAEYTQAIDVNLVSVTVQGIIADDKEYDGTTKAPLITADHELIGVPDGADIHLDVTKAEGSFADKNAGNDKPVTVKGLEFTGKDAAGVTLVQPKLTATISPKALTVNGVTANSKAADGTTQVRLNFDNATLTGALDGDDVELDTSMAEGYFADPDPGTNKTVNASGVDLAGADADNYTVTQPTTKATITPAKTVEPRNEPGNNLGSAFKRVWQDPKVNASITQVVRQASSQLTGKSSFKPQVFQEALDGIANALSGTDAVKAKCESCSGQLRVEWYLRDGAADPKPLDEQVLRHLLAHVQVVNEDFALVSGSPALEKNAMLFDVQASRNAKLAIAATVLQNAQLSGTYEVLGPLPYNPKFTPLRNKNIPTPASSQKRLAARPAAGAAAVNPVQADGFSFDVASGKLTTLKLYYEPPTAHVRCFCRLTGEGCCTSGKEYIESVCITAKSGEKDAGACATGADGSVEFDLPPGWYTFSAAEQITICGCNYELCCGSPISALVGAGQSCSDIVFLYKESGNLIVLDALISHPDIDDPDQKVAPENFPGMQYLVLSDCDQTVVQQQTSVDGSAVRFRVPAGTYSIYFQAPALWNDLPVQPVTPQGGRMTLRVFAGQAGAIPIPVIFRTCNTAPATLDGNVSANGESIPGQTVRFVNRAGRTVAAAVTDENGRYSVQIYYAEDLTIISGDETVDVSKKQIQAAMQQIVKPSPPYAKNVLGGLLEAAEVPGLAELSK